MSNIDKQALREEFQYMQERCGGPYGRQRQELYRSAEALLDELEAKDKRIAELEAREVTLPPVELVGYGDWPMFDANLVTEALRTAGINVAAAGKGE